MTQQQTIHDWIDDLQDLFFELETKLQALQNGFPSGSGYDQLVDDLNRSAAGAIANLLGTIKNQTRPPEGNLADLQTASSIARSYMTATQWIERLNLPDQQPLHAAVVAARQDIRNWLEATEQQERDQLSRLLAESATLAKQQPIAPSEIIGHLELAVEVLDQVRASRDLIDPQISRELAKNWGAMLQHIDTANLPQPTEPEYLERAGELLRIRELLDEAYDLLAEDISADSPLDVVNI
jgi:hypothetical protein